MNTMEFLKNWGFRIAGICAFAFWLIVSLSRKKEEPKPPAPSVEVPTDYTEKNEKIEEAHVAIVEKIKPVPKSDAASISAAIEEYNKE